MPTQACDPDAADVVLLDGSRARVRDARPGDEPALRAFFDAMGADTRRLRFFSPAAATSSVAHWAAVHDAHVVSLVAETDGHLIAHGEAVAADHDREAEVAFAVADEHHGHGLGTLLLRALAARMAARGIPTLRADVLADNREMLDVLRHAAPARIRVRPGYLEVRVDVRDVLGRSR